MEDERQFLLVWLQNWQKRGSERHQDCIWAHGSGSCHKWHSVSRLSDPSLCVCTSFKTVTTESRPPPNRSSETRSSYFHYPRTSWGPDTALFWVTTDGSLRPPHPTLKDLDESLLLLLNRFSRVRLCATPQTAAHQAPPSLGFSRQEHWSGLPFPSPMHEREKWK